MKRIVGITVSILASFGWCSIAVQLFMTYKEQAPLTVNEMVMTVLACFLVAFVLTVDAIERIKR